MAPELPVLKDWVKGLDAFLFGVRAVIGGKFVDVKRL
jgi:hypothetical protein